jgi:hypothetical protein
MQAKMPGFRGGGERAAPAPARRVRARMVITWVGGAGSGVGPAAAAGGIPAATAAVSLRGQPGRRVAAGGGRVGCVAVGGAVALAMAASTSGRHKMRLREPGGRPLGLMWLMLKVGAREPGALGGGGFGGRTVGEEMSQSTSPVEGGSKARA